ncbi:MAG: hypothetical protein ACR2NX_15485 [Chthoniobacterales bacterium]
MRGGSRYRLEDVNVVDEKLVTTSGTVLNPLPTSGPTPAPNEPSIKLTPLAQPQ